jgi:hypothetical protein
VLALEIMVKASIIYCTAPSLNKFSSLPFKQGNPIISTLFMPLFEDVQGLPLFGINLLSISPNKSCSN